MDFIKLKHLLSLYLFRAKPSGLIKEIDPRDFDTGIFGWGEYKPLHDDWTIPSISTKNQGDKNNCQWQATTGQKEVDEGIPLSARSLSAYGQKNGMVTGNGFSSLQSGQKALLNWGIAEESSVGGENIQDWDVYVSVDLVKLTPEAETHKIKSYWNVSSRNDRLKMLDEGRQLTTGIDWYTGYNQGGGFSTPWIISGTSGWKIGGHAFKIVGYKLNYYGRKVYKCKNSYGDSWGDNSYFYIDMNFFDNNNYGCYAQLDMPVEQAKHLNLNNMLKNSLRDSKGGIWFVKGQYKQLINSVKGIVTMITAEFGVETNDAKLSKYKDISTAKNPDGTPVKPFFPIEK